MFWRLPEPLDSMDEGSGENDRYWVVSHSRRLEDFKIEHTKLVIVNNMSEILTGVYSLVVNDPGYPGHRVHNLFNVTVTMPRESTVYSISSTMIILQSTSYPGNTVISNGIHLHLVLISADPMRNIGILVAVCGYSNLDNKLFTGDYIITLQQESIQEMQAGDFLENNPYIHCSVYGKTFCDKTT